MRHPFDGIILPDSQASSAGTSRRSALRWFAGAVGSLIAVLGGLRRAGANPPGQQDGRPGQQMDAAAKRAKGYRLFFVVPQDVRRFNTARRRELGVNGTFVDGWKGHPELGETRGFTAWMSPADAERLRTAGDVSTVHELTAEDKAIVGSTGAAPSDVVVTLSPNAWRDRPGHDTYLTGKELAAMWSKQFARFGDVQVIPGRTDRNVQVIARRGQLPDEVMAAIAADPQVSHIVYLASRLTAASGESAGPTTKAIGEEGGVRPPTVTTYAVGEEGGPTTKAIGEEGGRPPVVTTYKTGEEGGVRPPIGPTTKAIGEEGGQPPTVTTFAVGEEGGPRPPVHPTTKAIGEEGAGRPMPTTLAVGEEGGQVPPPRIPRTTKKIGEEGGVPNPGVIKK